MSWIAISLIAPFLWALVNHADKYLLSRYFKNSGGVGPLMIFSTLFGTLVLPVALYFEPQLLNISYHDIFILILAGIMSAVAIALYLFALEEEEASIVVPFWQTIPLFGYVIGYLVFKETFTGTQMIAGLGIIFGAVILSLDFSSKIRIRGKVVILMLASSIIFASYEGIFRFVALDNGFWVSTFWEHVGLVIFGIFLFSLVKKYREGFLKIIKGNSLPIISLNVGSEVLTLVGNISMNFALLLAPLAMVLLMSSYQGVFVFIIGVLITLFFPKIHKEKLGKADLLQKISAILIMCICGYYLY